MSRIVEEFSEYPFWSYLLFSFIIIWSLRQTLFELFAASFPYKWNKSYQKARAIRKEQSLFDRFTFRYTNDYICDRLKIVHKVLMIFKLLFDIWFVLSAAYLILLKFNLISYAYSGRICETIVAVSLVLAIVFLILYNPSTKSSRFINFKFPNR